MDPLALACTNSCQSTWLARADLFQSKTARSVLNYLKLVPIYRIRDGKDNLSNNEYIFALVTRLLENKKSAALFPEAAHSGKRQMLPHKKAIPRIALEAEEKNKFSLGLQIVPVGIYYSHYWAFNRSVIVQYGEPIEVSRYRKEYAENPQKAMLSLRDEIHARLLPLCLQINSEIHYQAYEDIRQLVGKAYSGIKLLSKNKDLQLFLAEKELISKLEYLESNQPEQFEYLIKATADYLKAAAEAGQTDQQIEKAGEAQWNLLLIHLTAVILSVPVFVFGFVLNALPFFIPRRLLRKKVKDITFLSTFNFVAGLVVFPVVYLIESVLLFAVTESVIISVVAFILMPFTGKMAWQLREFYRKAAQELKALAGTQTIRNKLSQLAKQRQQLIVRILEKTRL